MTRDLILGAFTGYDYNQLQYWINSIHMSGFDGDIVVIVGNASFATVEKLMQKNVKIIAFEKDDTNKMFRLNSNLPIQTERFFHFWNFLKDNHQNYRHVIITDMKDVIFQTNPIQWLALEEFGRDCVVIGSEGLLYKDEPWGRQNLEQAFGPYFYETFKDWEIYNVGVIAGFSEYMRDLCLNIFQMSINRPVAIVEQAAFNALVHTLPYEDIIHFAPVSDGWTLHMGTVCQNKFKPVLLEKDMVIFEDMKYVSRQTEKPFCIIHQWDRLDPEMVQYLKQEYGDKNEST